MKKWIWPIILILFVSSIVFTFYYLGFTEKGCETIEDIDSKDYCYYDLAFETKTPSMCDKIEVIGRVEGCYHKIAKVTLDISLCEKIREENYIRDLCLRDIGTG